MINRQALSFHLFEKKIPVSKKLSNLINEQRLNKINLSEDATEIMNIALLTNAHPPQIDISEKDFMDLRSKWLMKNSDLELIEEYLIKNQTINYICRYLRRSTTIYD